MTYGTMVSYKTSGQMYVGMVVAVDGKFVRIAYVTIKRDEVHYVIREVEKVNVLCFANYATKKERIEEMLTAEKFAEL